MRVTSLYNSANDIRVLKDLAMKLDIDSDERIDELEGILKQLQ